MLWAHRRKSYQCFGALINTLTDKIICWSVVQNKNFSPQRLENEVLKKFENVYKDQRIIGHVQDGDVKTINIVKKYRNDIKIF